MMPFSIYFANKSNLYSEWDYSRFREAKGKLEEIVNCFSQDGPASAQIISNNDYVTKVTDYEVTYEGSRAHLRYRKSRKTFNGPK